MLHQELNFEFDQVQKQQSFIPADFQLMLDLQDLIALHFKKYRDQEFYAEQLFTTIWILNPLCKIYYNKSIYNLIMDRVLCEAKALLCHSHMTGKQIAEELGFSDTSCFSRFFLRETGLRPGTYRAVFK